MDKSVVYASPNTGLVLFHCLGCKEDHAVWTAEPNDLTGAKWSWNGSLTKPTFAPSILTRFFKMTELGEKQYQSYLRGEGPKLDKFDSRQMVCHSFVREGRIEYLSDCTHELAGKTLDLPIWDEEG